MKFEQMSASPTGPERGNDKEKEGERPSLKSLLPTDFSIPKLPNTKEMAFLFSLGLGAFATERTATAAEEETGPLAQQEQAEILEDVLGNELREKYEKEGFSVEVMLEADQGGKYTIVIGQLHAATTEGLMGAMSNKLFASPFQEKLYELLPETAEQCGGRVFMEGVAENIDESKEYILGLRELMEEMAAKDIASLGDAEQVDVLLGKYYANAKHPLMRNTDAHVYTKQLQEKLSTFLETFTPQDEYEKEGMDLLSSGLALNSTKEIFSRIMGNAKYDSAALRLYMEDVIDIAPSESREVNEKAMEAYGNREDAERAYRDARSEIVRSVLETETQAKGVIDRLRQKERDGTLTDEEQKELATARERIVRKIEAGEEELKQTDVGKALSEAEQEFDQFVNIAREDAAVDRISELSKDEDACLVYGNAHTWTRAQQAENAELREAGDPGRGLIRMKYTEHEK